LALHGAAPTAFARRPGDLVSFPKSLLIQIEVL
jgi:hypothetical protein